ncbi:MAG: hypothetical protein KC449_04215 [Anaerolineales bacterium]|nr:hypothetical protein [Anaerolineales bacterium]
MTRPLLSSHNPEMTVTFPHQKSLPLENDDFVLVTQPRLQAQLLQARRFDAFCARSIIQRGESVYLSLREISDAAQRQALKFAILRLQMGAQLEIHELPEPLRTALSYQATEPSPFMRSLIFGSFCGVLGGVLMMAIVGLAMIVFNVPTESYANIMVTAITFALSSAFIGLGMTFYSWRKLTR